MIRKIVRSVIHDARVTRVGGTSLRMDPLILRTAEILPFEQVEIVNPETGGHVHTWAEPELEGKGAVEVPGSARAGDTITIVCYAELYEGQTLDHKPRVVRLDAQNQVMSVT